jgi:hypothetical protein
MKYILALYSGLHFLVDLASMYLLLCFLVPRQTSADGYFYVMSCTICWHSPSTALGVLADRFNKNALIAAGAAL